MAESAAIQEAETLKKTPEIFRRFFIPLHYRTPDLPEAVMEWEFLKNALTTILVNAMLCVTRIVVNLTWIVVKNRGGGFMPLYNRLKEYRARLGVNQQEMGALVGVSRQTISQIERGDYSPSVTLALKLAKICGVTVEDIFSYQEDERDEKN